MKSVSAAEQETIINYFRDEKGAEVYTCDTLVMAKLDKMCRKFPDVYKLVRENDYGKFYAVPKDRIAFRPPNREVSDEERQKLRERFAANAEKINAKRAVDKL